MWDCKPRGLRSSLGYYRVQEHTTPFRIISASSFDLLIMTTKRKEADDGQDETENRVVTKLEGVFDSVAAEKNASNAWLEGVEKAWQRSSGGVPLETALMKSLQTEEYQNFLSHFRS